MKIELLDAAEQDLLWGFAFYEKQERGLGSYFMDALCSDIDALQLYAGIHASYFGFHRLLSKRFPFAIYYRLSDETVHAGWGQVSPGNACRLPSLGKPLIPDFRRA